MEHKVELVYRMTDEMYVKLTVTSTGELERFDGIRALRLEECD
jgi:hypothetical protein